MWNNSTLTDEKRIEDYHILIVSFLITIGPVGAILNFAFIVLTLSKKQLRTTGYEWFMVGIASMNFVYCLNNCITQVLVVIWNLPENGPTCSFASLVLVAAGMASYCIQPMFAINRYFFFFRPENIAKYFSKEKIFFLISILILLCVVLALIRYEINDFGRVSDTLCGIAHERMPISHELFFIIPLFIFKKISLYCAFKMRRYIKKVEKGNEGIEMESKPPSIEMSNELSDMKEMMRFLFIEVFLPISFEFPLVLVSLIKHKLPVPNIVVAFFVGVTIIHSLLYPIVVVTMLKPYKLVLGSMCGKLNRGNTIGQS